MRRFAESRRQGYVARAFAPAIEIGAGADDGFDPLATLEQVGAMGAMGAAVGTVVQACGNAASSAVKTAADAAASSAKDAARGAVAAIPWYYKAGALIVVAGVAVIGAKAVLAPIPSGACLR